MKKRINFSSKVFFFAVIILLTVGYFACTKSKPVETEVHQDYTEKYRPQFHFTPPAHWMNDPNGMVYYDGEYHLFYQHYPDSTVWGPMHWGHALSTDLVHWEHLPIALYPDSLGYIFSGSAVVDWQNTTGFGTIENPPLVAIYTYHNINGERSGRNDFQYQGIAYSLDKGRNWTKYEKNPVLLNPGIRDFRDPKVFWNKENKKWIMTLAVKDHIQFYSSSDLINWKKESEFGKVLGAHGGVWECPDLFQLKVEGSEDKVWVLLVSINPGGLYGGSGTQYFVGDFDGNKFSTNQTETKWIDYGRDNYAGVTWSDIPETDERRLSIGWMSNWSYAQVVPTKNWRSALTVPKELVLQQKGNEYTVRSVPVKELNKLRDKKTDIEPQVVSETVDIEPGDILISRSEMNFQFKLKDESNFELAEEFGIITYNNQGEEIEISFNPVNSEVSVDRTNAGITAFSDDFSGRYSAKCNFGDLLNVRLYVDESSIEVFVNDGEVAMTNIVFPTIPYNKIKFYAKNGAVKLDKAEIWGLRSIW